METTVIAKVKCRESRLPYFTVGREYDVLFNGDDTLIECDYHGQQDSWLGSNGVRYVNGAEFIYE